MYLPNHGSESEILLSTQLLYISNSCSEIDHKTPVYELGAAPIFTNSDITEILKLCFSTHSSVRRETSKVKRSSPGICQSAEKICCCKRVLAVYKKQVLLKMHFPTVAAH